MSVFKTIAQRRSMGKMTQERPTRAQIERILEAATHAPNHHNAQPWRFFVLAGKARTELGEIMAKSMETRLGNFDDEKSQAMLARERSQPLQAPIVIVAAAEYPNREDILEIENIEAVAAAVQNMLLAAEELGLAAMWYTGEAAYDPFVKQWFGLSARDHIVAFVYLGYPALTLQERSPIPFEEKTSWLGWES